MMFIWQSTFIKQFQNKPEALFKPSVNINCKKCAEQLNEILAKSVC